eukprot:COSAG03_NODE_22530_length_290_cov_0.450262_1_plen_84_part_01
MIDAFFGCTVRIGVGRMPIVSIPDESAAVGAGMMAAILTGRGSDATMDDVLLLENASITLGVEMSGGKLSPLVRRGHTIPTAHH